MTGRNVDDEITDLAIGDGLQMLADRSNVPSAHKRFWLYSIPRQRHKVDQVLL